LNVCAQQNGPRSEARPKPSQHIQTGHVSQLQVQQHDVGRELFNAVDCLRATCRFARYGELRVFVKQPSQALPENCVIVND
jgi:hypothetical protein